MSFFAQFLLRSTFLMFLNGFRSRRKDREITLNTQINYLMLQRNIQIRRVNSHFFCFFTQQIVKKAQGLTKLKNEHMFLKH